MPGKARSLYPYPKSGRKNFSPLGYLDGRTKACRIMKTFRDQLINYCGGAPSATQLQVIDQACWLKLRLATLDGEIASGKASGFDNHQYLAWSNSLRRTMRDLGFEPAEPQVPSLAEVLKAERVA